MSAPGMAGIHLFEIWNFSPLLPEEMMVWWLQAFDFTPNTSGDSLAYDDNTVFQKRT